MKLEKREITLNEYDSLKEVFYLEKTLLNEYVECLCKTVRKETREELLKMLREVGKELVLMLDLMNGSAIENGEN